MTSLWKQTAWHVRYVFHGSIHCVTRSEGQPLNYFTRQLYCIMSDGVMHCFILYHVVSYRIASYSHRFAFALHCIISYMYQNMKWLFWGFKIDMIKCNKWYNMKWYDRIWYMICYTIYDSWYMIWYDMIYDMIWHDMIWHDMIWHDMIWYMIRDDTIRDETWRDVTWYMIIIIYNIYFNLSRSVIQINLTLPKFRLTYQYRQITIQETMYIKDISSRISILCKGIRNM